jgi:hypothetical protein
LLEWLAGTHRLQFAAVDSASRYSCPTFYDDRIRGSGNRRHRILVSNAYAHHNVCHYCSSMARPDRPEDLIFGLLQVAVAPPSRKGTQLYLIEPLTMAQVAIRMRRMYTKAMAVVALDSLGQLNMFLRTIHESSTTNATETNRATGAGGTSASDVWNAWTNDRRSPPNFCWVVCVPPDRLPSARLVSVEGWTAEGSRDLRRAKRESNLLKLSGIEDLLCWSSSIRWLFIDRPRKTQRPG